MSDECKLMIEAACAAWEAGNLAGVVADCAEDVEFFVHAPAHAPSFVGRGRGKAELVRRLGDYLRHIKVMYYEPLLPISRLRNGALRCRVHFVYRHRTKSLEIEGTMRQLWRFEEGKVARLDIFYDALGMRAFYDLVDNVGV
jgi:ketosteroid isomerase-like protein